MGQLRLVVAAAACATACRASEAGPTSGLTPPVGWRVLPELQTAATEAATQANMTVEGVEAWGEPARGCYATWIGIRSKAGAPAKIAAAMLASLGADFPGLIVSDVVEPDPKADAGILSLGFTRPPYRGRVRAAIAKTGAIGVLACFWNLREPIACDAACNGLVGGVK